ncbi:helix-turn-helix domain-containing protein [Spirosoma radiotolerans]|uniref:AraC family transcriptional regulator n=1 Tax=Spirosoma radiotolerans TaxID=1379870 RepID=A0A0E3V773_9BACT|nr:helix-turn-helix transcriptional regulator [Spirosoma radiotolerans]AKD55161.1 AraC family transcriptional regulator [Spirosoma radiotolerans]
MAGMQPFRIKTISDYHQVNGLPKPEHPLISVINLDEIKQWPSEKPASLVFDFYSIALKRNFNAIVKYKYGQQAYDFDEGVMFFIAPGQVFSVMADRDYQLSGWMVLVHPDFLWNTPLAKKIKQYEYFSYSVHEALHLSEKEEVMVTGIMQYMAHEYHANMDKFSQDIMIAQLDLVLTYADRFYQRQFITRKITNHQTLDRLEAILARFFNGDALAERGLPSVQEIADALNVSPTYLSGLLKVLTGRSTQQHIHDKLIDKAKEQLSTTDLSVSEIAYALGFEHPQSFSKLFKTKTMLSPLEFRQSFN